MINTILPSLCIAAASANQILAEPEQPAGESPKEQKICRLLSLSGGGTKGSYEVGALKEILTGLEAPHN